MSAEHRSRRSNGKIHVELTGGNRPEGVTQFRDRRHHSLSTERYIIPLNGRSVEPI